MASDFLWSTLFFATFKKTSVFLKWVILWAGKRGNTNDLTISRSTRWKNLVSVIFRISFDSKQSNLYCMTYSQAGNILFNIIMRILKKRELSNSVEFCFINNINRNFNFDVAVLSFECVDSKYLFILSMTTYFLCAKYGMSINYDCL